MLKWIVVLGVCALLAGCHDKSDAQKGAESEKTVTAMSTKYPIRPTHAAIAEAMMIGAAVPLPASTMTPSCCAFKEQKRHFGPEPEPRAADEYDAM
jgi:hypothetical protein